MLLAWVAVLIGLAFLVWSSDKFVLGSSGIANHFGVPPLIIGMVIVGFGTSAPEMLVSVLSAWQGNSGLALGNAYGSNISNIGLILGVTALVSPIAVHSKVIRKELPILALVTILAGFQLYDATISRLEGILLLVLLVVLMGWTAWSGMRQSEKDPLDLDMAQELKEKKLSLNMAFVWLVVGLVLLIASSRMVVWGVVSIAQAFGISDLVIGLTIVAIGTSLPELASSLAAALKGEHDIALGNVIGSNLFNTLAVVGLAGTISPMAISPEIFSRDIMVMGALTFSLFIIGYGFRGPGRVNRFEGGALLLAFLAYMGVLLMEVVG